MLTEKQKSLLQYIKNVPEWHSGLIYEQLAGATPFGLGAYILIPNVREALKGDLKDIKAYVLGDEPKAFDLYMAPLTDDERQIPVSYTHLTSKLPLCNL